MNPEPGSPVEPDLVSFPASLGEEFENLIAALRDATQAKREAEQNLREFLWTRVARGLLNESEADLMIARLLDETAIEWNDQAAQ